MQRAEQAVCGTLDPLLLIPCKAEAELIFPSSSLIGVVLTKLNFVRSQNGVTSDADEQLLVLTSLPMWVNAPLCSGKAERQNPRFRVAK